MSALFPNPPPTGPHRLPPVPSSTHMTHQAENRKQNTVIKNKKLGLWRTTAVALAGAVVAMSLSVVPATAATVNPGTVDGSQVGSITVHKFQRPSTPTGLPNNGTQVSTTGLTPLAGIGFTIQQVNTIDLTTNAGWQSADTLSNSFDPANAAGSITSKGYSLGTATVKTTDSTGTAAFTSLPLGLYLVQETTFPAGVTPSAPFLVSVPLTDPNNKNAWLYNVHVYPKNSITTATKTVQDASAVKLGDAVNWTITGGIPTDAVIDGYKIADKLDAKLTYVGATVSLADGTAITAGTDYNVVFDAPSNTVSVVFTASGRAILAAHNTTTVKVVVNTKVNTIGEIANTALVYPNNASIIGTPGNPGPVVTPPVVTKWGNITIQKVDQNDAALAGASFSVYGNQADAKAGTNPITLGGQTVFTVGANGQLTISGLRYSDFANGATVAPGDAGYNTYYLVETTAPTGYELLAAPVSFLVTAATTAVGVDLQVKNVPSNAGFQLPFTGGPGTTVLYGAGILILAGAVLLFVRSRRTSNNS
jgi:fimbrial isopeptide formation D2 family protein